MNKQQILDAVKGVERGIQACRKEDVIGSRSILPEKRQERVKGSSRTVLRRDERTKTVKIARLSDGYITEIPESSLEESEK